MKNHLLPSLTTSLLLLFSIPVYLGCKNSEAKKPTRANIYSISQQSADTLFVTSEAPVFYAQTTDLANLVKGNIQKLVLTILLTKDNFQLYFWRSNKNNGQDFYNDEILLTNAGFTKSLSGIKDAPLLLGNLELTQQDRNKWKKYIQNAQNANKYIVFEPELQSLEKDGIKANAIVYTIRDLDHKPTPADIPSDLKLLSKPNPSPPRSSY